MRYASLPIIITLVVFAPVSIKADHDFNIDYKCKDKICIIEVYGAAKSLFFNGAKVAENIDKHAKFTYKTGEYPFAVEWEIYNVAAPTQYDTPHKTGHFIVTKPVTYFPDKQTNWSEKKPLVQLHGFIRNYPICSYNLMNYPLDLYYPEPQLRDLFDLCLQTTITIIQYNFYRTFAPLLYPY